MIGVALGTPHYMSPEQGSGDIGESTQRPVALRESIRRIAARPRPAPDDHGAHRGHANGAATSVENTGQNSPA